MTGRCDDQLGPIRQLTRLSRDPLEYTTSTLNHRAHPSTARLTLTNELGQHRSPHGFGKVRCARTRNICTELTVTERWMNGSRLSRTLNLTLFRYSRMGSRLHAILGAPLRSSTCERMVLFFSIQTWTQSSPLLSLPTEILNEIFDHADH